MQSIQLHPLSLLTGIGLALVAFVAMGQSPQPISPSTSSNRTLEFFARPRDFVQVDEGSTFVVPSGKLFEPTAIGARPPMMNSKKYELVALDGVLAKLEAYDSRKCEVVMLRYFAGPSIEETAAALGVSPATWKNEWAFARAWLHREMSTQAGSDAGADKA